MGLIKKFKNLVVMRSFSKAFGLAGARIGYIVSEERKLKFFQIQKVDMKQICYRRRP